MLHPSYSDLMNVVNSEIEEGETPVVNSRYSIVMATSKRARQIVDGCPALVDDAEGRKALSVAVDELEQGLVKILPEDAVIEDEGEINFGDEEEEYGEDVSAEPVDGETGVASDEEA